MKKTPNKDGKITEAARLVIYREIQAKKASILSRSKQLVALIAAQRLDRAAIGELYRMLYLEKKSREGE